jgi:hypothetical protein
VEEVKKAEEADEAQDDEEAKEAQDDAEDNTRLILSKNNHNNQNKSL